MFIIAVVSQKGGSGKTTLSGHLSVQAHLSGDGPVAIIDTDPQGSLAAWWNEREDEAPIFVQTSMSELSGHLENLRQAGVKQVIIDTPPAITTQIHEVIRIADYVVVPTKPSPHDLRAVGATVKLVQSCAKPMVFVLNDASARAKITYEAAIALSQHGTVAPVTIHHRTLYASSMIDGRTAMELQPGGQSAVEITGLWEYLNARLHSEILPTAIGLDAMNRRDGTKKHFAIAAEPEAEAAIEEDEFDDSFDEGTDDDFDFIDDVTDAPAVAAEIVAEKPPVAAPAAIAVVKPVVKPVAPSIGVVNRQPAAITTYPTPGTEADPDLWSGFAPTPGATNTPRPEPVAANSSNNVHSDFGHRAKGFGRRQVV